MPCEIVFEGERAKGFVLDLSAGGLFIQAQTRIGPGTPLEIRLGGSATAAEITLQAEVVRSRRVPLQLASTAGRGIGVRLLEAPAEYYELLGMVAPLNPIGGEDQEDDRAYAAEGEEDGPRSPRCMLAFCYRVRVKQKGGPRSRTLVLPGESPEDAAARATEKLGEDWEVINVEDGRLLRVRTDFEAVYSSERIEGSGTLVDISLSGARLEDTEVQPKIGSAVRADAYAYASANDPVRLVGEVVRHTPRGFALQFTSVDEAVRRLVFEACGEPEGPD